ncbi:TPA: hypothetical protein OB809_004404 [Escherichia coli]|nr:hypothetical protein [Escherichia coli]
MDDQQIQLALHMMQLVSDRLFFLRGDSHPHAICGAGFLMALLHGKEFATNAEVVEALAVAYKTIPQVLGDLRSDAPGCTGYNFTPLEQVRFDTMTLQLLDLLRGLRYVPETNSFLIFQDFYNNF